MIPELTLPDGMRIPQLGIGFSAQLLGWRLVETATRFDITLIDLSSPWEGGRAVADALALGRVKRAGLFLLGSSAAMTNGHPSRRSEDRRDYSLDLLTMELDSLAAESSRSRWEEFGTRAKAVGAASLGLRVTGEFPLPELLEGIDEGWRPSLIRVGCGRWSADCRVADLVEQSGHVVAMTVPRHVPKTGAFGRVATDLGVSVAAVCIAWAMAKGRVVIVEPWSHDWVATARRAAALRLGPSLVAEIDLSLEG
ncbi:hypothetical protein [Subtercola boreus]|uniref:hypothetical protein n=1 Tax=Subtercola boreus TaxID=120213 RepID=UPI00114D8713|nr:hypothetical protein [Subtercola boreus]TQL52745.1 diketogulonate reductase-like aldo/keto reductase [Subtercola boreus]